MTLLPQFCTLHLIIVIFHMYNLIVLAIYYKVINIETNALKTRIPRLLTSNQSSFWLCKPEHISQIVPFPLWGGLWHYLWVMLISLLTRWLNFILASGLRWPWKGIYTKHFFRCLPSLLCSANQTEPPAQTPVPAPSGSCMGTGGRSLGDGCLSGPWPTLLLQALQAYCGCNVIRMFLNRTPDSWWGDLFLNWALESHTLPVRPTFGLPCNFTPNCWWNFRALFLNMWQGGSVGFHAKPLLTPCGFCVI